MRKVSQSAPATTADKVEAVARIMRRVWGSKDPAAEMARVERAIDTVNRRRGATTKAPSGAESRALAEIAARSVRGFLDTARWAYAMPGGGSTWIQVLPGGITYVWPCGSVCRTAKQRDTLRREIARRLNGCSVLLSSPSDTLTARDVAIVNEPRPVEAPFGQTTEDRAAYARLLAWAVARTKALNEKGRKTSARKGRSSRKPNGKAA